MSVKDDELETEAPELGTGEAPPDPVRDRLLTPLLLPLLAILGAALLILNISRVFLAASSNAIAVTIGIVVTLAILAGAAAISASPRMRSSTVTMSLAVVVVVVIGAGLVSLGTSLESEEGGEGGGYVEPAGDPTSMLSVDAGPGTKFQSDEFSAAGGILEIAYVDMGESHTLAFEEPEFEGFELAVPQGPAKKKVEISEGDYTIYCTIPGHRANGMEATLTITPGAAPAEGATTTTAAP